MRYCSAYKALQIASKSGWIAGDNAQTRRSDPRQLLHHHLAQTGARRIGQYEIGSFAEAGEIVFDIGVYGRLREVVRQVAKAAAARFHCSDLGEPLSKFD